MGSVNKVILVGNLGGDPEVRFTASNHPVAHFNLATTETWRDKNGEQTSRTEWHRIVVWGKLAENISQYLSKGKQVYIEGKIRSRSWEGKDGVKRYTTEIVADKIVFLGKGERSGQGDYQQDKGEANRGEPKQSQDNLGDFPSQESGPSDPDDIPF